MIIIADSGSTKTNWYVAGEKSASPVSQCQTTGINPFYQDKETILQLLKSEFTLRIEDQVQVFFYGAGCSGDEAREIVAEPLRTFFTPVFLSVESDLMAAARSLCGHNSGIACIMGTGSNSCYYNGEKIISQVPSLGYILGDEGSGADIGRRLIADILKNQVPVGVADKFFSTFNYSREDILVHVYKNPFPNRFLAQFATFVSANIGEPALRNLVKTGFGKFFRRNISQYPQAATLPVHFTGSISWHFRDILTEVSAENGVEVGTITQNPMQGLIKYHL
jgi:glucosamine kinase